MTGNDKSIPFLAFGDESKASDDDTLVYAYVIFPRQRLAHIERKISNLKKTFKIPQHISLHCSKLMSPNQREKLGIGHLSTNDIRNVIAHAVTLINNCSIMVRYASCSLSGLSQSIGKSITLQSTTGEPSIEMTAHADYKGYLGMLGLVCMTAPIDNSGLPAAMRCQVFSAEEKSKAKLFGDKAQQAHNYLKGYVELPPGNDENFIYTEPTIAAADAVPCFQLADIAAYLCANALRKNGNNQFFIDHLSRVKLISRSEWPAIAPQHLS